MPVYTFLDPKLTVKAAFVLVLNGSPRSNRHHKYQNTFINLLFFNLEMSWPILQLYSSCWFSGPLWWVTSCKCSTMLKQASDNSGYLAHLRHVPTSHRFDAMLNDLDGSWTHCFCWSFFLGMSCCFKGGTRNMSCFIFNKSSRYLDYDGSIPDQIDCRKGYFWPFNLHDFHTRFGENLRAEQWLNLLDLLRLWRLWEPSAPIIVSAFGCLGQGCREKWPVRWNYCMGWSLPKHAKTT